jgi:hypothetical protein
MLVATREPEPRADMRHFGPLDPPRSALSRLTGGVQLLGSLIGIPLALVGGYSTWHANFSPEAKCQALRANIVSMLDRKADATTLRLLVQRDVAAFQRDCDAVDPDAVAAFKTLLTAEKTPAVRHVERAKAETKVEAVAAPVKVEAVAKPVPTPKVEVVAKPEPKPEPKKAPVIVKREADKPLPSTKPVEAKPAQVQEVKHELAPAPQPEAKPLEAKAAAETKPAELAAVKSESERIDTAWVASVREALRESAAQPPAAETSSDLAAPLPPPIVMTPRSKLVSDSWRKASDGLAPPVPPADIPAAHEPERPVPPAPIPDAAAQPAEN